MCAIHRQEGGKSVRTLTVRVHVSSRYIEVTRLALDENFHLLDACENIDVRNSFQVTCTLPPPPPPLMLALAVCIRSNGVRRHSIGSK